MEKRDDYKQKIMNMDAVFAKLVTLNQATSEQQLNARILVLLEEIGDYTQSERVYIFDWTSPSRESYQNTFEWCRDGVSPCQSRMKNISVQDMPYWQKKFEQGDSVLIENVDEVLSEMLRRQGIHTDIAVPIMSHNCLNGFSGLDNPGTEYLQMAAKLLQDVGIHISYIRENHRYTAKERAQMKLMAQALEEAQRANAAKSEFLSRMSHGIAGCKSMKRIKIMEVVLEVMTTSFFIFRKTRVVV